MIVLQSTILIVAALATAAPAVAGGAASAEGTKDRLKMIIDFAAGTEPWRNIDDVVMGGVSHSEMVIEDGVAVFRGVVSLDNNGGFASVRSQPRDHNMSGFSGIVLRLRGDGKSYAMRLRTTNSFDGVSYQAMVQPAAGEWSDVTIPFSAFVPVFRGSEVAGHPPLDPGAVRSFGLLISERQEGPFRLEMRWIAGVTALAMGDGRRATHPGTRGTRIQGRGHRSVASESTRAAP